MNFCELIRSKFFIRLSGFRVVGSGGSEGCVEVYGDVGEGVGMCGNVCGVLRKWSYGDTVGMCDGFRGMWKIMGVFRVFKGWEVEGFCGGEYRG